MRAFSSRTQRAFGASSRALRCQCSNVSHKDAPQLDRRGWLAGSVWLATSVSASDAVALPEMTTLYGLATPPTSYGGYGGNKKEEPKYMFEYPADWKQLTVNKVQKGTQGIDVIVQQPRVKQNKAFVIALARAGEDNKTFKLTDTDATFSSFVGADYDLQDAVATCDEIQSSARDVDGQKFYDYVVQGSDVCYVATITVNGGKVYAMFVSSPAKSYSANKDTMKHMILTFRNI